eukprot:s498_g11.t5
MHRTASREFHHGPCYKQDGETSKCPVMPVVRKARDKVVQAAKEAGKWARQTLWQVLFRRGQMSREQFFIEKQRNASEDQRKSELQRLARMQDVVMKPDQKDWLMTRASTGLVREYKCFELATKIRIGVRLVSKNCPRHLLGTMLGLKNALDGMAGTAAPAVGGMLYYIGRPLPYTVAAVFAFAMAVFYISLPPSVSKQDMSEELKPLMTPKVKAETEEAEVKAPLRHVQSSALPLSMYAGKHYSSQCLLNQLSLVMDPELRELYNITVDRIEKEKGTVEGTSGIRSVATVCSGLSARTQLNQMNRSLGEVRPMSSDNALAAHLPRRDDDSPDRSMA